MNLGFKKYLHKKIPKFLEQIRRIFKVDKSNVLNLEFNLLSQLQ